MKFMFVSFFLTSLIGFLSVSLFVDTQSINSQVETIPSLMNMSVKITSPSEGKQIPSGELTISGISSDSQDKNCIVFVDWNDLKPFQKVRAAGSGGIDDFSEWIFTYDSSYHEIIAGNNELTSKITCLDGSKSLTKWNSINVTGYSKNSSLSPVIQKNTTSLASTSKQLPLQTILPGSKHNNTIIPIEQNTTTSPLSNVSSAAVEMVIPNESTQNTNNSISASPQSNSNLKSKQSTFGNPRIDLDEQQPLPSGDEQSNNQTMVSPAENQTMVSPAENQTMVSPTENQTMVSPTENQTMVSPTENQTMVSPTENQTMVSPTENQTMVSPTENQQQQQPQQPQLQPPTLDNQQQQPQLQPPTLDNQQQQPQLQPPTLGNDTTGSTGPPSIEGKSPTEGLFPPFQLPSLFP